MVSATVAIVGAGPIGLELAAALKKAGVDYLQFDSGQIGQTISWYPGRARFFSSPERIAIAGVPLHTPYQDKATREEYLAYLRGVVEQFDLEVRTYENVTALKPSVEGFTLHTASRRGAETYEVNKVVLAIGDMARPRLLHIPGEDLDHVSHYFDEPHQYFRKKLLIVGGHNSAVEAALRCHHAGAHVTISYRQQDFDAKSIKYWLMPEIQALIRRQQIGFHPNTVAKAITPTHVVLTPAEGGPATPVEADFVLLLTGYIADTTLLELAGVRLEGEHHVPAFDVSTMQTNVPGIFIAGTAAAGTQEHHKLFIENCHIHVERIVRTLTGQPVAVGPPRHFGPPEN